jgi:translocation and assembly module TamB
VTTRPQTTRSRRTRLGKWLIRLAVAAAAVALLIAGAAWFLLGTEPGARWLFARVGAMMAGSLEVAELDGPIRGPLAVRGLVYESDGFEVRVDRLALDWRLRELVHRRLDVVDLEAQGVRVLLADREARDEPQALPDVHLPVNIIVRGARVRDLVVVQPPPAPGPSAEVPAEPLRIDSIELVTRAIGDGVEIERRVVRSPDHAPEN